MLRAPDKVMCFALAIASSCSLDNGVISRGTEEELSLELDAEGLDLEVGETVQVRGTPTLSGGSNVTGLYTISWSSSDPAVATVEDGLIVGMTAGTTRIAATVQMLQNGAVASDDIVVSVGSPQIPEQPVIPESLFTSSDAPPSADPHYDGSAIAVGVKLRASVAGSVLGVRFFKAAGDTGAHVALLYDAAGTLLAEAPSTNETASGWQDVRFATPVAIGSGTTYTAAYFSAGGYFVATPSYFTASRVRGVLTGLADGQEGPNGVYAYTDVPARPTSGYQASNYWVDVAFEANAVQPSCGDASCNGSETCSTCAADCGACAPRCGDASCNGSETCSTCAADCGACAPRCGDASCNASETCSTCAADCGACAPSCGDASCNGGETCSTCAADCGACAPRCGDASCNGSETCSTCAADCGSCGTTSPLNFTIIPYSDPDLVAPGRGVEQWHDGNLINVPVQGVNTQRLDRYHRFSWTHFETQRGVYDFTFLDNILHDAIDKRQKFSFGIMTAYPELTQYPAVSYDGGTSVYPEYLHDLMQAESPTDWRTDGNGPVGSGGSWVPNWNSPSYLARLLALNQAINQHLETGSHGGVSYADIIGYIDIRGYGSWGEWHSYGLVSDMTAYPAGTRPTLATLNRIIDIHVEAYPDHRLVTMIAAFDANRLGFMMNPPEVAYHALTAQNNVGLLGWRRDSWGAPDEYLREYTDRNNVTVNGMLLRDAIMDRYKYAPVVGEPCCAFDYGVLEEQVRLYHVTSFGNENYAVAVTSGLQEAVRAASKAMGYRLVLEGGAMTTTLVRGQSFTIALDWHNVGIGPTYEDWDVAYELRNASNTVVWSGASSFEPRLFLPAGSATRAQDTFTLPAGLPSGSYTMVVVVRDAKGYRAPLPLAITGRASDGSYRLRAINL